MKFSLVCHGNIARSQILNHYLAEHALRASLKIELFSCGTAPREAYPEAERLLIEVRNELKRRGLKTHVERTTLDDEAKHHLANSDLILAADENRRRELITRLGDLIAPEKVMLFYEYMGEGSHDFVDTYDAQKGAQDPVRFAKCFDELERIARRIVERIPNPN